MKAHEFTFILTEAPNEDEAERLYSLFNDGTIATIDGVPQIDFHREAPTLEEAIATALGSVRKAGFEVVCVEIEPTRSINLRRRGISEAEAAEMHARFAPFVEDWDSPEMSVYDNYDEEFAKLQAARQKA